jgi:hypothetical protein
MKKSRIASPVPHPESSLRHLPLVDPLVDTRPSCWNCGERLASHTDANAQLFDYLEVFYNQRRRHWRPRRPTLVKYDLMRSGPD